MEKDEEVEKGVFWTKVQWRKARVQSDGGFSLAELPGLFISCRGCNVPFSIRAYN